MACMLKELDLGDKLIRGHIGSLDKQGSVDQWLEATKVAFLSKQ